MVISNYTFGMPFESSMPLVVACVLCGFIATSLWTRTQTLWLVGMAVLFFSTALGLLVADRLVVTDREYLQDLFPRLARAAEQSDMATVLAAVDPDLHSLGQEAEQILKRVRPTRILITFLEVNVDGTRAPPQATADVVVRVAGNMIDLHNPGDMLAEFRVLMHKKEGEWLISDVQADRTRLGQLK